jgi:L-threonylcarbamoyladenylate synthase
MIVENDIEKAVQVLNRGGVIIAPTDSVYGLFGDTLNENTVKRIRHIKGREGNKPFQIAVIKEDAERYAKMNQNSRKLIEKFWPGDVNIILEKKSKVPAWVSDKTVCLTCHRNRIIDTIVRKVGKPLVSTSVNLSGMLPAVKVGDIDKDILNQVDFVIDFGETKNKRPNTIVDATIKPVKIVREGFVSKEELNAVVLVE